MRDENGSLGCLHDQNGNVGVGDCRVLARVLIQLVIVLLVGSEATFACIQPLMPRPQTWISGDACQDGEIVVTIHDYSTFAAQNSFCACALDIPFADGRVVAAQVADPITNLPLSQFGFVANPNSGFGGSLNWQGFLATNVSVASGLSVNLRFHVRPPVGGNCMGFAKRIKELLRNPTGAGVIGTGGADVNGAPIGHINIVPAGCVAIEEDIIFVDDFESGDTSAWSAT